jgi:ankyrin repeat protein
MSSTIRQSVVQAARQGDIPALQRLLAAHGPEAVRAEEDPDELTALHWAAAAGHLEVVKYLLSAEVKADPKAARKNNFTPLHSAAMMGHAAVCQVLLEAGTPVNTQTSPQGYAALHSAAFGGHLDAIRVLLAHGASRELRNYRNERPADTAKRQSQRHVVALLQGDEFVAPG